MLTNWITGELFALLNEKNIEIDKRLTSKSPKNLASLVNANLVSDGNISGKIAKNSI